MTCSSSKKKLVQKLFHVWLRKAIVQCLDSNRQFASSRCYFANLTNEIDLCKPNFTVLLKTFRQMIEPLTYFHNTDVTKDKRLRYKHCCLFLMWPVGKLALEINAITNSAFLVPLSQGLSTDRFADNLNVPKQQ